MVRPPAITAFLSLFCLLWVMLASSAPARANVAEDDVKAAFLLRFASFVTWPASAFADPSAPILICSIGAESLERKIGQMAQGRVVDGHPFKAEGRTGGDVAGCHILYVIGADVEGSLRAAHGAPILTVTDSAAGNARGVLHFVIVQERVRFHVDEALAAKGELSISSKLLALAVSVRMKAPQP